LRGHEWKASDEFVRFCYRTEGFLKSLVARVQTGARKNAA